MQRKEQIEQIENNIKNCQEKREKLVNAFEEMITEYLKNKESFKYYETTQTLIEGLQEIQEVNEVEIDNLCAKIRLQ